MSWFTSLLGSASGGLVKEIGAVADTFITTPDEKKAFELKLEQIVADKFNQIEDTHRTELQAKERVLVAELNQDDKYTKRARPTVVYFGLLVIFLNYVLFPLVQVFGYHFEPIALPVEFWYGWSGIVTTWTIGRSLEKVNLKSKTTSLITGSVPVQSGPKLLN